jgi:Secretion system C-terminal sorting domain
MYNPSNKRVDIGLDQVLTGIFDGQKKCDYSYANFIYGSLSARFDTLTIRSQQYNREEYWFILRYYNSCTLFDTVRIVQPNAVSSIEIQGIHTALNADGNGILVTLDVVYPPYSPNQQNRLPYAQVHYRKKGQTTWEFGFYMDEPFIVMLPDEDIYEFKGSVGLSSCAIILDSTNIVEDKLVCLSSLTLTASTALNKYSNLNKNQPIIEISLSRAAVPKQRIINIYRKRHQDSHYNLIDTVRIRASPAYYYPPTVIVQDTKQIDDDSLDYMLVVESDAQCSQTDTTYTSIFMPYDGNNIVVAPNPTDGIQRVLLPDPTSKATFNLYNTLGQLIRTEVNITHRQAIDFSDLQGGFYFIIIEDDAGHKNNIKIEKR